jgi:hypothetical protein
VSREVRRARLSDDDALLCSFCGKSKRQVEKLIGGPSNVHICDECVELCNEILGEELTTQRLSRAAAALEKAKPCRRRDAARKLVLWPSGGRPSTVTGR